jgi:hypothetical protein
MPMRVEREPGEKAYDSARKPSPCTSKARPRRRHALRGRSLLLRQLHVSLRAPRERLPHVVVPGVTSITASAAALRRPLSARNEVVKVLPATLPEDRLRDELLTAESAAIIKVGRHLPKIRNILGAARSHVRPRHHQGHASGPAHLPLADITEDTIALFLDHPRLHGPRSMVKPVLFVLGASALPLARKLKACTGRRNPHAGLRLAGGDITYPKATAHLGSSSGRAAPSSASARRASSSAPWPPPEGQAQRTAGDRTRGRRLLRRAAAGRPPRRQ